MTMTQDEIEYCCGKMNSSEMAGLSKLMFKNNLTKEERASLSEEELDLRKKIHAKKGRYRYKNKNPEKYSANLEKLKALKPKKTPAVETIEEEDSQAELEPEIEEEPEEEDEEILMTPPKLVRATTRRTAKPPVKTAPVPVRKITKVVKPTGQHVPIGGAKLLSCKPSPVPLKKVTPLKIPTGQLSCKKPVSKPAPLVNF